MTVTTRHQEFEDIKNKPALADAKAIQLQTKFYEEQKKMQEKLRMVEDTMKKQLSEANEKIRTAEDTSNSCKLMKDFGLLNMQCRNSYQKQMKNYEWLMIY